MHSLLLAGVRHDLRRQMLIGYYVGAMMAINGTITVGTFLAYMGLIIWIIFPMRNLGRLIVQISTGMVSYNRVMDILASTAKTWKAATYQPDRPCQRRAEFSRMSGLSMNRASPCWRTSTLNASRARSVALLGSTGSGKTSLVNLLPRFYDYTSGRSCWTAWS
jgi:ATP-binding cassette, subfamily B, bacterial